MNGTQNNSFIKKDSFPLNVYEFTTDLNNSAKKIWNK